MSKWIPSEVTITLRTASGRRKTYADFAGVIEDEEHPFKVSIEEDEVRGGIGNCLIAKGDAAHIKLDFWVKASMMR